MISVPLMTTDRMQELANALNRDGVRPDPDGTYPFWTLIGGIEIKTSVRPNKLIK
jgi:hypothetical protein